MASADGKHGSSSGPARFEHNLRGLVHSIRLLNLFAFLRGYLSMAITIIAYLAFAWSTAVLLGGYVTSLKKKDFWCLTVISLLEAMWLVNLVSRLLYNLVLLREYVHMHAGSF